LIRGRETNLGLVARGIKVTPINAGRVRGRRALQFQGLGAARPVAIYNNSLNNIMRAVTERVFLVERDGGFYPPPSPVANVFRDLDYFKHAVAANLPGSTQVLTLSEVVESYQGMAKQRASRAVESLKSEPFDIVQDSKVKVFVKYENIPITVEKPDPRPEL